MSYDLAVFYAAVAPDDEAGFQNWYRQQAVAPPLGSRPELSAWCRDMEDRSGPFDRHATRDAVCASFGRSLSTEVFHMAFELAGHHEVGLYDPRGNRRWLPNGGRGLYQWSDDRGAGGSSDAVLVARAFLEALCESGDLERDEGGDWADLTGQVTSALDRARRRSPIPDLWKIFISHDAVGEIYLGEEELKAQLDRTSEAVLGHPPTSDTGWV